MTAKVEKSVNDAVASAGPLSCNERYKCTEMKRKERTLSALLRHFQQSLQSINLSEKPSKDDLLLPPRIFFHSSKGRGNGSRGAAARTRFASIHSASSPAFWSSHLSPKCKLECFLFEISNGIPPILYVVRGTVCIRLYMQFSKPASPIKYYL